MDILQFEKLCSFLIQTGTQVTMVREDKPVLFVDNVLKNPYYTIKKGDKVISEVKGSYHSFYDPNLSQEQKEKIANTTKVDVVSFFWCYFVENQEQVLPLYSEEEREQLLKIIQ